MKRFGIMCGLVLAFVVGTIATSSLGAEGERYTGCVNEHGSLLFVAVGDEPLIPCVTSWTQISWNQEGPVGPQGPQGEPGPQGPPGDSGMGGPPGTLIDAGSYTLESRNQGFGDLANVQACETFRVLVTSDQRDLSLSGWAHTSADGVHRVYTNTPGGPGPVGDSIPGQTGWTISQEVSGPYAYYAPVFNNSSDFTASIQVAIWCSFGDETGDNGTLIDLGTYVVESGRAGFSNLADVRACESLRPLISSDQVGLSLSSWGHTSADGAHRVLTGQTGAPGSGGDRIRGQIGSTISEGIASPLAYYAPVFVNTSSSTANIDVSIWCSFRQ